MSMSITSKTIAVCIEETKNVLEAMVESTEKIRLDAVSELLDFLVLRFKVFI